MSDTLLLNNISVLTAVSRYWANIFVKRLKFGRSPREKIICLTRAFPFADQPAGTIDVLSSTLSTNVCLNLYVNGVITDRGTETIDRPLEPGFTSPDAVLFLPIGRSAVFTRTRAVFGGMLCVCEKLPEIALNTTRRNL